ncbi:MAG TPA: alpha/beta fold hydrolase [Fimbriimonas sp.]|nr:alpha/beta fold hydrolase [Fimbriimonas sp.]
MKEFTNWLDRESYPFALREFDSGEGWMNYVDEGSGRPIVFVHGSMAWSFLFRDLVSQLSSQYRCVALDHLGFGLSDTPEDAEYTMAAHSRRFGRFIKQLGLRDITLVVIDAGGPIALDWANDNPELVRDVIFFNTHLWSLRSHARAKRLANMLLSPINRFYYRVISSAPVFVLAAYFADRHAMTPEIQQQYLKPFFRQEERKGIYALIESWRKSGPWYDQVGQRSRVLQLKQTLMLWGMKDPMFDSAALAQMQSMFPEAQTVQFENSGRYVIEEQSERVLQEIRWFLLGSGTPSDTVIEQIENLS